MKRTLGFLAWPAVLGLALIATAVHADSDLQTEAFAHPFIIQGEKVLEEEAIAGSVVLIRMPSGQCTGTLVGNNAVVTASHCTDMGGSERVIVQHQGGTKACKSALVASIARPNDAYFDSVRGHFYPDLTLMRLSTPICDVKPASAYAMAFQEGDVIQASGYGKGTTPGALPDRLSIEMVSLDTVFDTLYADLDESDPMQAKLIAAAKEQVTAGAEHYDIAQPVVAGQSLCNGDSGGPAYVERGGEAYLVGVNGAVFPHPGRGAKECRYAFLQFITPVAPYADWITKTASSWVGL